MPTCRLRTDPGYTLLEMLIVLAILGIAATVAATALSRKPGFVERERIAGALRLAITAKRDLALSTGKPQVVDLSSVAKAGEHLQVRDAVDSNANRVTVYPDGSTSGGVVENDRQPVLRLSWLTGAAARAR